MSLSTGSKRAASPTTDVVQIKRARKDGSSSSSDLSSASSEVSSSQPPSEERSGSPAAGSNQVSQEEGSGDPEANDNRETSSSSGFDTPSWVSSSSSSSSEDDVDPAILVGINDFLRDGFRYRQPVIGWLRDEEERFKTLDSILRAGKLTLVDMQEQWEELRHIDRTRKALIRARTERNNSTEQQRRDRIANVFPRLRENSPFYSQFCRPDSVIYERFFSTYSNTRRPPIPLLKLFVFAILAMGTLTPDPDDDEPLEPKVYYADQDEMRIWISRNFRFFIDPDNHGISRNYIDHRGAYGRRTDIHEHTRELFRRHSEMVDGVFIAVPPYVAVTPPLPGEFWGLPVEHLDHVFEDWYTADQFLPWRHIPDQQLPGPSHLLNLPNEVLTQILGYIALPVLLDDDEEEILPRAIITTDSHLTDPIQLFLEKAERTYNTFLQQWNFEQRPCYARLLQKNWLMEVAEIRELRDVANDILFSRNRFSLQESQWRNTIVRPQDPYDIFVGADWIKSLEKDETRYLSNLRLDLDAYDKKVSLRSSQILRLDEIVPMLKSIGSSVRLRYLDVWIDPSVLTAAQRLRPLDWKIFEILRKFRGLVGAAVSLVPVPTPGNITTNFLESCMRKAKRRRRDAPPSAAAMQKHTSVSSMLRWSDSKLSYFESLYPHNPAMGPHTKSDMARWIRNQMMLEWRDPRNVQLPGPW